MDHWDDSLSLGWQNPAVSFGKNEAVNAAFFKIGVFHLVFWSPFSLLCVTLFFLKTKRWKIQSKPDEAVWLCKVGSTYLSIR